MRRSFAMAAAGLALVTVLLDPYTWHLSGSAAVLPAPPWQVPLGLLDACLLAVAVGLLWRGRGRRAADVLAAELLFALALGIVFVLRDGLGRFRAGLGGEEYLALYFGALPCAWSRSGSPAASREAPVWGLPDGRCSRRGDPHQVSWLASASRMWTIGHRLDG